MLIVLYVSYSLIEVAIWTNAWCDEAVLNLAEELFNDGHSVFSNDYAFEFLRLDLVVPLVRTNLLYRVSFCWVCIENRPDQVLGRLWDETGYQVITIQYLLVELAGIWVLKRQIATSHGVQYDATAPYIRVQALISLASDHLWSRIAWRSASCFQSFTLVVDIWQTKIHNLDVVLIIKQQILWLQISVTNPDLMYILNTRYDLLRKPTCLIFLQALSLHNIVKEFTTRGVLHDQEELARGFNNLYMNQIKLIMQNWLTS